MESQAKASATTHTVPLDSLYNYNKIYAKSYCHCLGLNITEILYLSLSMSDELLGHEYYPKREESTAAKTGTLVQMAPGIQKTEPFTV